MALGQESPPAPAPFVQTLDVVATTPADAWGGPRDQVPANVQSLGAAELRNGAAAAMERRLPGVQLQEGQGSSWQPDLQFRGFSASPLLGIPQGLAVYQDGVRLNDPFGDTVRWDLVPTAALARLDLLPGSNPLFGLNALGGALLLETRNGFGDPGPRATVTAGSFGRRGLEADWGLSRSRTAVFVSVDHQEDAGWRDFSPARTDQLFGRLDWAGSRGGASLSLSAADNRLSGNGPSPVPLLQEDREAVFTFPDRSDPRSLLLSGRLYRSPSPRLDLEAHVYYRRQRLDTLNGDAASFAPCATPGEESSLCQEGEATPLRDLDGRLLPAGLAADAVENRTTTDQRSAGGGLQLAWHAGEGERTSRTVVRDHRGRRIRRLYGGDGACRADARARHRRARDRPPRRPRPGGEPHLHGRPLAAGGRDPRRPHHPRPLGPLAAHPRAAAGPHRHRARRRSRFQHAGPGRRAHPGIGRGVDAVR